MLAFYKNFDEVCDNRYDGLIITGAPVEQMEYEDVDYWDELCRVFEWSKTNVFSTIHICWGAQAGLYYHYGVPKYPLKEKMFGNFKHHIDYPESIILKGFGDVFHCPHSRHTEVRREDIEKVDDLIVVAVSNEAGVHLVSDRTQRQFFCSVTGNMIVRPLQKSISEIRKRGCLYRYHIAIFLTMIRKTSLFSIGAVRLICFIQTGSTTAFIRKRHMILTNLSHWGLHNEERKTYS